MHTYASITESMRFVRGLSESMHLRQQTLERRLRRRAAFALLCVLQRCVAILVPLGLVGAATQQQLRDLGAAVVGRDHERGVAVLQQRGEQAQASDTHRQRHRDTQMHTHTHTQY